MIQIAQVETGGHTGSADPIPSTATSPTVNTLPVSKHPAGAVEDKPYQKLESSCREQIYSRPYCAAVCADPPQEVRRTRNGGIVRTFRPGKNRRYGRPPADFPPAQLVKYSPKHQYSRINNFPYPGAHFQPRMNTMVIQVHGISRTNNASDSESAAAVGVYHGPQCVRNSFYPLPIQFKQTANRAVLESIRCALQAIVAMRNSLWPGWHEVIIMTNSDYAKQSLSYWVWMWEKNDWNRSGRNETIENVEAMQNLHGLLSYIENTLNMSVRFWKVRREDIAGADMLAQRAMASGSTLSLPM